MDKLQGSQPYFIYERITLVSPIEYFLHTIDYGFFYLLRSIVVQYPEIDSTGAIFGPHLRFESVETTVNHRVQNEPIPFELVTTPGSSGVAVNAADQLTATQPLNQKKFNVVHPNRDVIEFRISGQNGTTPELVDIMLVGYLIPFDKLKMWGG